MPLGAVVYGGLFVGEKSKIPNIGGIRRSLVEALPDPAIRLQLGDGLTAAGARLMVPSMRILFSSTRGAGHLQPLLPYARALVARRHEVAVAAPEEVSKTVRDAGLPHLPVARPFRG